MNARCAFAVVFAAFCCVHGRIAAEEKKITLDVYYESLCPDSIYFITKQLAPNYKHLKDLLKVNLHPFGKSSWTAENDSTKFECQHGPKECEGNRAQACALHAIDQIVKVEEQQQDKKVAIVNCTMSSSEPNLAVPQCAALNGVDAEAVERIKSCSGSKFGDELLVAIGERTNSFQKPLKFVPSILVNGEKKADAFKNLNGVICQLVAASGEKPSVCSGQ